MQAERVRAVVLSVDSDPQIALDLKRCLESLDIDVLSVDSGPEALTLLDTQTVDAIISDVRLDDMDGTTFLKAAGEKQPEASRILLTGFEDAEIAMRAVNEAGVSAFITRPWDDGRLRSVVGDVLERHLREQERHHLELRIVEQNHTLEQMNDELEKRVEERTEQLKAEHARLESAYSDLLESHRTTVNLLANVIALRDPEGCTDLESKKALAVAIAREMRLDEEHVMVVEQAMALHRIGLMGIDDHALHQPSASLRGEELTKVHRHPLMAEALLMGIPHLQRVAEVLRSEHERFDGLGFPDRIGSAEIPLGSRIIAVARDFHDLIAGRLVTKHYMPADALTYVLEGSGHQYDPAVVDAFKRVHKDATHLDTTIEEAMQRSATLEPGMCLSRDLMTPQGLLLLNKNQVLTASVINKIKRLEQTIGHHLEIFVRHTDEEA